MLDLDREIQNFLFNRKRHLYTNHYEKYRLKFLYDLFRKYITKTKENKEKAKILDVGVDIGEIIKLISSITTNTDNLLIGLDINNLRLKCAKINLNGKSNIALVRGEATKLPFNNSFFDFVICLELIEHLNKKYHMLFLREIQRVAKEKAIIIISTPNLYSIPAFESN